MTLPAVAAGHLILQVRAVLFAGFNSHELASSGGKYGQSVAAIEASFNVTETFLAISFVLSIVAAWMVCVRRVMFVALIGLLCFAVECYIHFSGFLDLGLTYDLTRSHPAFSRLFVADFVGLVIGILVTVSVCGLISAAIALLWLLLIKESPSRAQCDVETIDEAATRERMRLRASIAAAERSVTGVTTLFLPIAFVMSLLPPLWHSNKCNAVESSASSFWQRLGHYAVRFVQDFFPRTAYAITDLDQIVPAAAGATVLAFSICGVARCYYQSGGTIIGVRPSQSGDTELSGLGNRSPACWSTQAEFDVIGGGLDLGITHHLLGAVRLLQNAVCHSIDGCRPVPPIDPHHNQVCVP